jgi:hypothetical protein
MLMIETDLREVREVSGYELAEFTERGWELICVVQEKGTERAQREVKCRGSGAHPCKHGYHPGSQCFTTDYVDELHEITVTKYLIGRDKDDAMAGLGARFEALEHHRDALAEEIEVAAGANIEQKMLIEKQENEIRDLKRSIETRDQRNEDLPQV